MSETQTPLLVEYQGMCQVELVDVVVELPNVNPTVLLRERGGQGRECWFPIGQADGVTLSMAWRGTATPRPLTHELMADIFVRFGLELDVVKITGCSGKTYLAELVLSREGQRQSVACRPSDALTLALRRLVPAPIMVVEELMRPGPLAPVVTEPAEPVGITEFPSAWPFDTPEPEIWPPPPWLASQTVAQPDSEPLPDSFAEPQLASPTEPAALAAPESGAVPAPEPSDLAIEPDSVEPPDQPRPAIQPDSAIQPDPPEPADQPDSDEPSDSPKPAASRRPARARRAR